MHTLHHPTPHVWWYTPDETTDRPVLGAVAGTHSTLIIDAGNSPAHARLFQAALQSAGVPTPTFLLLTHWHWDHIFGTALFDIPSIASHETRQIVTEMAQLDWSDAALDARVAAGTEIAFCRDMMRLELPDRTDLTIRPPTIGFSGDIELDLGGVTAHLIHVGGDHASDATIVSIPAARVAFLSDCIYPAIYTPQRYYTPARLFPLIDQLEALPADIYFLGHGPEPLSRHEFIAWTTMLRAAGESVARCASDRDAALTHLAHTLGHPLDEEALETIDLFLAGSQEHSPHLG